MASSVRRLVLADKRLAISDVARKLNNATQFCGSAMVSVPTGGRKKRLNATVARSEDTSASTNPQVLATTSTNNRYANPIVVAFTGTRLYPTNVRSATPAIVMSNRKA